MARPLAKSPFVLLALGLGILACPASLTQQVQTLFKQGRYQEAIPIAERAVEVAKRVPGLEHPDTATSLNNLARQYQDMGEYAKAERSFKKRSGSTGRCEARNIVIVKRQPVSIT